VKKSNNNVTDVSSAGKCIFVSRYPRRQQVPLFNRRKGEGVEVSTPGERLVVVRRPHVGGYTTCTRHDDFVGVFDGLFCLNQQAKILTIRLYPMRYR